MFYPLWKKALIVGICLLGALFALPNALPESTRAALPAWLPRDAVNLGLDLRGGAHLLVEVQIREVVADRMQSLRADARAKLTGADVRRFTDLRATDDAVTVRITNAEDVEKARTALASLGQPIPGALFGGPGGIDLAVTDAGDQVLKIALTEPAIAALTERTMQQSLEIILKRIDEAGTREPTIQRQGLDRVLIQVPGVGSAEEVLSLIGKTAKLTFHKVDGFGANAGTPGPGQMLVKSAEDGETFLLDRRAILTGDQLVDSQLGFHPTTGAPVVNFRFDTNGARIFGDYTVANVGQLFAIVLDNDVVSAPRIQTAILGGSGFIEGNFTTQSATELSILLRSGALPASIKVLEQRTVGPDLGADSIEAGTWSTIAAGLAVVVLMLAVYRLFGWIAIVALAVNLVLIFGLLSAIGVTLTLPGIAGIVLTIGMAVDANVLIYERIREELRAGRPPARAIDKGFEEAMSSIVDANLTTMIAAVVLFAMGYGPVKGFAITLAIGVVTSVFTSVYGTRMLIAMWFNWARPKTLRVERYKLVPDGTRLDFLSIRKFWVGISAAGVVGSIILASTVGMNYGIDFRGGTMVEFRTPGPADLGQIRQVVDGLNLGDVAVQSFGNATDVLVRVEQQSAPDGSVTGVSDKIGQALIAAIPGSEVRRVEVVGPKVSGELLLAASIAILLTTLAIQAYIWIRFEWQFGIAAVAALVHDVATTVGLFSLLGIEFNLSIIAALLTIAGYSMNDTVVVFDRVRENLRKYKQMGLIDLLNLSLNETLSRTVMTAGTTLIALVAMLALGPAVIQGFTFAMLWGVIIGTYSSVFVAAALLLWLGVKRDWVTKDEAKAAALATGGAQV